MPGRPLDRIAPKGNSRHGSWHLWADSGYAGAKLKSALAERGPGPVTGIGRRPNGIKGFTVPCPPGGSGQPVIPGVA